MLEELFTGFQLLTAVKIAFLILAGIYVAFLLVVYKQARAMQAVVNDNGASTFINSIALLHVIIGISIFVAALIIL